MAKNSVYKALLVLLVAVLVGTVSACPPACTCGYGEVPHLNTSVYLTNCSHSGLDHLPEGLPNLTTYLDISDNKFVMISENRLLSMRDLKYLDARRNPLHSLPLMSGLDNLTAVYVDEGAACCIYEIEWERREGSSRRKEAAIVCRASQPYTECDRHLIRIPSLITYSITFLLSLIFNPWIFVVTLLVPERRQDPFTLANAHFSISNLMITIYSGGILVVGGCLYDQYHYHMEQWLDNPICGVLGYLLVTASLASTVLYTFEIIIVFLKVKYPFQENKHMTVLQLNIGAAILWVLSCGIAAIPFGLGRYNAVGLCLPFYGGDYDFSFKYVLLYTAITNVTTIFNMGMHIYVLKIFIKKSKDTTASLCEQRRKENRHLRNTVVITLVFYILISLSEMVFLIMSCVGGPLGQIGREWWSRMVILEAVVNPLTGPMRNKRFFRDTQRLFNKLRPKHERRPSIIDKVVLELKKLKDKKFTLEATRQAILAESPILTNKVLPNDNCNHLGTSESSVEKSPELPRIEVTFDTKSVKGEIPTITNPYLEKVKKVSAGTNGFHTELGASPVSQATLVSDISDTDSEKGC